MPEYKNAHIDDYQGYAGHIDVAELAREAGFTKLSSQAYNVLAYLILKSPDGIPAPEALPQEFQNDPYTLQSTAPEV